MSTYEAISLMLGAAGVTLTLVSVVIKIVEMKTKK